MEENKDTTAETEASSASGGAAEEKSRLHRAREKAGETMSAATGAMKDSYASASEAARKKVSAAKEKWEESEIDQWIDRTRQYVRDNPGKALLISVGAGFLIGLLLRRDEDDD